MESRRAPRLWLLALCGAAACEISLPSPQADGVDSGAPGSRCDGGGCPPDSGPGPSTDAAARPGDGGDETDAGPPPVVDTQRCPPEAMVADGCVQLPTRREGDHNLCDGLDNDCDGVVDDGCPCTPGSVQDCFPGPPGKARVGACRAGQQACLSIPVFEGWGPCEGATVPQQEVCDAADNDCNGCADEIEGCEPRIACPEPGDPRVPWGQPFMTYTLDAHDFYTGGVAAAYRWSLEGSACDRMFRELPGSTANATNGQLSYKLSGANSRQVGVDFTLSGTYEMTLEVDQPGGGETLRCSFPIHVGAAGLRVELCWQETGPTSRPNPVDLDLRLGRHGTTGAWNEGSDCNRETCVPTTASSPLWDYPSTADESVCIAGVDEGLDLIWSLKGECWNPRIDLDNVNETDVYRAENISLDRPRDGDTFRVLVQHRSTLDIQAHPLLNVYCGGRLFGSFGGPDAPVEGFGTAGSSDEFWRVVDVRTRVDAAGNTTGCELTPLHPPDTRSGYWITDGDFSF